jgi:hypothetical protein
MNFVRNVQLLGIGILSIALTGQPQKAMARAVDAAEGVQIEHGSAANPVNNVKWADDTVDHTLPPLPLPPLPTTPPPRTPTKGEVRLDKVKRNTVPSAVSGAKTGDTSPKEK